jgi:hypothetical protein
MKKCRLSEGKSRRLRHSFHEKKTCSKKRINRVPDYDIGSRSEVLL